MGMNTHFVKVQLPIPNKINLGIYSRMDLPRTNKELRERILAAKAVDIGLNHSELGRRAGVTRDVVRFIFERDTLPESTNLVPICRVLDSVLQNKTSHNLDGNQLLKINLKKQLPISKNLVNIQRKNQVPVAGFVGAGLMVYFHEAVTGGDMEMVKLPVLPDKELDAESTQALKVAGGIYPGCEDGATVYYCTDNNPPYSNGLYVLKIENGATIIRYLRQGGDKDKYNLSFGNEPEMLNQKIEWASRVEAIIPT